MRGARFSIYGIGAWSRVVVVSGFAAWTTYACRPGDFSENQAGQRPEIILGVS